MIRNTWIRRLFASRPPATATRKPASKSLRFETLEDRTVPAVLDLTSAIGVSGVINAATYTSVDPQPMGTGVIDPFVRIQRNPASPTGTEQGYNTDGIEEYDTKDAGGHNWDHSLKLSDLQPVIVDGVSYYQFTLDVNETKPGALISLDELQVFVQGAPNLTGATFNADGTITSWKEPSGKNFKTVGANLVYDLDGAGDSSVLLNYALNRGSGSGDMTVLIPTSQFPAIRGQQYVYLYSKFSNAEAGFEEWTAQVKPGGGPVTPVFSLSGHKYNDLDGDGNIEAGEPTLPGWTITLYQETDGVAGLSAGDAVKGTDVTDANGFFEFTNLAAGTYYTQETIQSGWVQTFGGNTENGDNDYYTTLVNGDIIDIDFANFKLVDISGQKVTDITGDGASVDDTGLGGVTINLFKDANGNGALDDNEDDVAFMTTTTAADGTYTFEDLGPGTYFVQEVVPAGYVQTFGGTYTVVIGGNGIQSGGASTGNDFGNFELFDICGEKFRDIDKDGVQDANEPLLAGWTINLYKESNNIDGLQTGVGGDSLFDTEVTGSDGSYCFTDLAPGTYYVREVQKTNWQQYTANPAPITGTSGVDVDNVDFGNAMINPGIGHTKGYWHNQNGHATIDAMGGWDVVKVELANLYLRNLDGTLFFASNPTQAQFDDFLTNDSNGSNMVSQLSAQLAAAYLNMRAGAFGLSDPEGNPFASGDTLLSVSTSISPTGYITVSDLVAEGRRILHGNNLVGAALTDYDLIDPSPAREYANLVMSALDAFNNSTNIVNA
jgi:uncharacterized protein (DUF2141 family)